jgi:hypothetical protein
VKICDKPNSEADEAGAKPPKSACPAAYSKHERPAIPDGSLMRLAEEDK